MILICLLFCFCGPPRSSLSAHLRLLQNVWFAVHKQNMNTNYRISFLIVSRQEKNNSDELNIPLKRIWMVQHSFWWWKWSRGALVINCGRTTSGDCSTWSQWLERRVPQPIDPAVDLRPGGGLPGCWGGGRYV